MTQDLKPLLDRATDRPTPYVPDVDHLLTIGRRRTRVRHLTGALATVAAVGAVATAGTFAFQQAPESAAPASSLIVENPDPGKGKMRCGVVGSAQSLEAAARWAVVVSTTDAQGSSSVRRAPDGRIAYCTAVRPDHKSVLILGGGAPPKLSPYWMIDAACTDDGGTKCPSSTVSFGPLPPRATRITVKTVGNPPGDATVHDGYFVYRHRTPALDRAKPTASARFVPPIVKAYDATGHEVPIPK
ncbi:hypothetical protein [Kribbella sp. NPDC006257]|uniref:hypothetical protein n=1 Tax=Kribbella sp. NPDC006257 TaxID=3156738 RepID=UPI0033BC2D71